MLFKEFYEKKFNELELLYEKSELNNIFKLLFENHFPNQSIQQLKSNNNLIENCKLLILSKQIEHLKLFKPIQYILNECWFYKFPFFVNENVLIPRPETEQLVVLCISELRKMKKLNPTVLDIGTGSGCIAISIKKEFPNANITAIDISNEALKIAKKNADNLNVIINLINIDFLNIQLLNQLPQFDLIVSNPPYITPKEKNAMHSNVLDYEPNIALFVSENEPLIFYNRIANFVKNKNTIVFCEINETLGIETKNEFENFNFNEVKILKDFQYKDRMLYAKK